MKKKILSLLFLSTFLFFSEGCKKFLDINKDPNHAEDVTVQTLLPAAQTGLTFALGNTLTINGGIWSQYWTQNPNANQYNSLDQYAPAQGDFDNVWSNLQLDALENFQKIIDKGAGVEKLKEYVAVATILKVYTFQLVTDLWGDVPYSQTLQGDATKQVLNPKFDSQSDIYAGLVTTLDNAIAMIDENDANTPGGDDLIYGGDMSKWLRFAHTLKLKIGLRLAKKDAARAQGIVHSLDGVDFIQPGETAQQNFSSVGGQQNPLYGAIAGPVLQATQNLVASSTAVNFFRDNHDPRLEAFYNPVGADVVGIPQGSFNNPPTTTVSAPSTATGADAGDAQSALAPVKLMTDYESSFLQAEAAARGWISGDATTMYNAGITQNFLAYGLASSDASDYYVQPTVAYPTAGSVDVKVKAIITQKWAAMCGNQTIEAWTQWRRTGYPSFFTISEASIIGAGRVPGIFLYPTSEMTRNPNAPKSNHFVYDKVWWAQ